ncbi:EscU/YscU/HrcU family type III secretion system export apparatus switch protein [Burkholderia ambifaria]|uniref:EscU/YscU/HrcU family type III secretion system export apparatus switch protein n=1 Tax=Burkholderia ambifaria TaxID=152480 RepID=UPI001591A81E|nr:EscU/YscU/HrcU family type III secretion system export apparatus switch protein [Burkholderia ambifaria]
MSGQKTAKPTPKRKQDAGKKGQSWRSADVLCILSLAGIAVSVHQWFAPADVMRRFLALAEHGFAMPVGNYVRELGGIVVQAMAVVLAVAIVATCVPSLLMSRFRLGTQVLKVDFTALNPVNGFKRIFNKRALKDAIKALLYAGVFLGVASLFWATHRTELHALGYLPAVTAIYAIGRLAWLAILTLITAAAAIAALDMLTEYLLYIHELKMSQQEVKQEVKDTEGDPMMKRERRRINQESLSQDVTTRVEQSNFVVANPTHIAIGIYINPEISMLPFISVLETDGRALAVIAHATKVGVPVIRDIPLARRIFAQNQCYSFVSPDCLEGLAAVLRWLVDVENSRRALAGESEETKENDETGQTAGTHGGAGDDEQAGDDQASHEPPGPLGSADATTATRAVAPPPEAKAQNAANSAARLDHGQ